MARRNLTALLVAQSSSRGTSKDCHELGTAVLIPQIVLLDGMVNLYIPKRTMHVVSMWKPVIREMRDIILGTADRDLQS